MPVIPVTAGNVAYPENAAALAVTVYTASTPAGDTIDIGSGTVVVCVRNSHATLPYTFTINGEILNGRDATITKSLTAGQECVLGPFEGPGWATSAGLLSVASENAAILWGPVRLRR